MLHALLTTVAPLLEEHDYRLHKLGERVSKLRQRVPD